MKKITIIAFMLLFASQFFAQNASDVLRYSYLQPGGTARYVGAGGAFGALGAEFGGISQNPAGLALFRSDELTLTPSLHFANTEAKLEGGEAYIDNKSKFGFDNVGLVFNTTPSSSKWKTFNFAIGYNRQADYNHAIYYEGKSDSSIMVGFFEDYKDGVTDPFGNDLAVAAGAIFQDTSGNVHYDFEGRENEIINRGQAITTFGRMNEMAISFAGNYDEKLMVGFTVGVPFVNYRLEGEYIESDPNGVVEVFDQLTYTEYLRTSGVGVNLKLGVIYKVSQALRLGAAFHTPTALALTDSYGNTFAYEYTLNGLAESGFAKADSEPFDYKLRTPWRASASAALVVKKIGFLSADVEWIDYAASRFNFTADVASQENQKYEREVNSEIQNDYQQAMNMRLGAELALDEFRLRGGFNLLGKPGDGATGFNTGISAGAGVRGKSFYLDLGWRRGQGEGSVQSYAGAPVANTKVVTNDFLLTVGFKF